MADPERPATAREARIEQARIRAGAPAQMSEHDAAYHVGAPSVSTFRLWIKRGRMPAGQKEGKYRLWRRADLDVAVERMHAEARAERPKRKMRHAYDPQKIAAAQRRAALGA